MHSVKKNQEWHLFTDFCFLIFPTTR